MPTLDTFQIVPEPLDIVTIRLPEGSFTNIGDRQRRNLAFVLGDEWGDYRLKRCDPEPLRAMRPAYDGPTARPGRQGFISSRASVVAMTLARLEPARLRIRIRAEVPAVPDEDHESVDYIGDILLWDGDFETSKEIGFIAYRVVPVSYIPGDENEDAFFTMDALDDDATYIAGVLGEHFREVAPDGIFGLLVIDNIWIDHGHRSKGVASHVIWGILKPYLAAMTPDHAVAVLYSWDKAAREDPWERIDEKDPDEFAHRVERLHMLFERAGFSRIRDTRVVCFPLERVTSAPSVDVFSSRD